MPGEPTEPTGPRNKAAYPDTVYAGFGEEEIHKKLAIMRGLWERHPNLVREIKPLPYGVPQPIFWEGWFLFPQRFERFNTKEAEQQFDETRKRVLKRAFAGERFEEGDPDVLLLAQEYKIHLMPQEPYIPFAVETILSGMETSQPLHDYVAQFKVMSERSDFRHEVVPTMVVYPVLGAAKAQEVLNALKAAFADSFTQIHSKKIPRFSIPVNGLISWSEGDSTFKKTYLGDIAHRAQTAGSHLSSAILDQGIFMNEDLLLFRNGERLS